SASYLGLCPVCTRGTPVADILVHSPPLSLIIDHIHQDPVTTAEDEGILLALQYRDSVRRVRLLMPVPNFQKLIVPQLRSPVLMNFAFPIMSPMLSTSANLVTLLLQKIQPSAYFHPTDLLRRLSLMPQLETLGISFLAPVPNREVERHLLFTLMTTHATLPSHRSFGSKGVSVYLEALLPRVTAPLLEKLQITFFNQLTFSVPHLVFMGTTEDLSFRSAKLMFHREAVFLRAYPHKGAKIYAPYLQVGCSHLD
ncbi:hypothetical protein BC826DRAFT_1025269, partial [Russula brevipes]